MIPGLRYVPDYLDATTHDELLAAADTGPWRQAGDRRMQISLGSSCVMEFTNDAGDRDEQFLEPMSALVIAGEARSQWKHAIPTRTHDTWLGRDCPRSRRVSLTFRKMRLHTPASNG